MSERPTTRPKRHRSRPAIGWVRKNIQIDQRKLDAARAILGTTTETDTVDAALDAIAFRREAMEGARRVRAAGGITDIYAEPKGRR
jgi:Arc/MetJ family transcription regulator